MIANSVEPDEITQFCNLIRIYKKSAKISIFLSCFVFVCLFALRPKSTAMVIAGRSVHLTTLFSWASLNKQLTSNRAHTFACNWQQPFMNDSAEGRRMTVEIISWSIFTKVWDRAGIELTTPGSAVSFASVTRHITDCATRPSVTTDKFFFKPDLGPNCLQKLSADDTEKIKSQEWFYIEKPFK